MIFFESSSRSIFLLEHDLRANASRLSRGKTGTHPASSAEQAFSGSCCSATCYCQQVLERYIEPKATLPETTAMVPFFVQFKCKLGQSYAVANALAEAEIASEIYSTAGDYDLLVKFYVDFARRGHARGPQGVPVLSGRSVTFGRLKAFIQQSLAAVGLPETDAATVA